MIDFRCAIESDGIMVIPRGAEQEAIAREKASAEGRVAVAIREGMSVCEAFSRFGVM